MGATRGGPIMPHAGHTSTPNSNPPAAARRRKGASAQTSKGNGATEYDFARLEGAVTGLVEAHQRQLARSTNLQNDLDASNRQRRELEGQILEANQKRQDVMKRIDELIAQIDQLDAQLAQSELGPEA